MQLINTNGSKTEFPECCPEGQLIQWIFQSLSALSDLFGELNLSRHPYKPPPSAFETSDIYEKTTGGW